MAARKAVAPIESTIPHPNAGGLMLATVNCAPIEIRKAVTNVMPELTRYRVSVGFIFVVN